MLLLRVKVHGEVDRDDVLQASVLLHNEAGELIAVGHEAVLHQLNSLVNLRVDLFCEGICLFKVIVKKGKPSFLANFGLELLHNKSRQVDKLCLDDTLDIQEVKLGVARALDFSALLCPDFLFLHRSVLDRLI